MKKKLCLAMTMAMVVSLAGCGGGGASSDSGASDNGGDSGEGGVSGSITIWEHDYSFEDSLEQIIAGFQEEYPNVEVDYEIKADGDYYSLLQTAIQSGSGPDLFWTNGTATANMPDLVSNDACADLTDLVDYSFISDAAMDLATMDDGIYSVPWMTLDTRTASLLFHWLMIHGPHYLPMSLFWQPMIQSIAKDSVTTQARPMTMRHEKRCRKW